MDKLKIIQLTGEEQRKMEKGYQEGKSHAFSTRCQMVLLKSEKRISLEVAGVVGCCEVVVNNWLARFQAEGIEGLKTRLGRGRPPILSSQNPRHLERVKAEIKKHPNSVKTVLANLVEDLD